MGEAAAAARRVGEDATTAVVGISRSTPLPHLRSVIAKRNDALQDDSPPGMRGREIMIRENDGINVQHSLRLHGPAAPDAGRSSKLIARVEEVVRMKINLDDVDGDEYAVDIQCVRAVDLPRGAASFGIISAPLSQRGGAASDLPEIGCFVDLRHLRCASPTTDRRFGLDHAGRRG